ncbi:MAG TPA: ABC transporter permease [Acidimicrobiales bacterium]|jgi:ABC-2 type transport system permease protein/oleandomycin transport system permease protein|nr:ABC transporter permease [Acidimicrobiales bacterium]
MAVSTTQAQAQVQTQTVPTVVRPAGGVGLAVQDSLAVAGRNLRGMRRVPEVIVFSTIQPVMFVLMFRYVFGGAIHVPGVNYVDYLMPGIFVQTIAFGGVNTVIGLADDLNKGMIERFRSLPMARSAVLAGRTVADLVRNLGVVVLMILVGVLVGFRIHAGLPAFVAAGLLLLLFSFALSWAFALVALSVANPEAAQAASFPPLALLVFASSAFVPVASMPGWLQAWAKHQPVSVMIDAIRALVLGGPTTSHVVAAVAWAVGIIAVFAPLAVYRYRRAG